MTEDRADREPCPRLVSHHVGGRSGSRAFPILHVFEPDVVSVLYEADRDCVAQIERRVSALPSEAIVLPYCLSDRVGRRAFRIYKNQYLSSFYPLEPAWAERRRYQAQFGWDSDPGGAAVHRIVDLETRTLDSVLRDDHRVPSPDFLSLDTQGSELEILRGAGEALERTVVAVQAEVWFTPAYRDQCLFGDIASFLEPAGFALAALEPQAAAGAARDTPIGLRGDGRCQAAEALFLKEPSRLPDDRPGDLRLLKLAFFCFLRNLFDETYEILRRLGPERLARARDTEAPGRRYVAFLADYARIMASYPAIHPVRYTDILTDEAIDGRFSDAPFRVARAGVRERYFASTRREAFHRHAAALGDPADVGVERLARGCGLVFQADLLKRYRLEQAAKTRAWLGL